MPSQTSSKTLSSQLSSSQSSQVDQNEQGFETLLKPLTYILSHVWDAALTQCLERYLNFLKLGCVSGTVNFKQAAVLLQNSTSFYCRRVDLVYSGCQEFVLTLQTMYYQVFGAENLNRTSRNRHDKGDASEENEGPTKKRKTQKSYENNTFEELDFMCSDHNINVKLQNIDKNTDKKCLILSKNVKAVKKPHTSCTVYQENGKEMGYKDDFRINWPINSKGILNEEIVISPQFIPVSWGPVDGDESDLLQMRVLGGDMLVDEFDIVRDDGLHTANLSAGSDLLDPPCPPSPCISPIPLNEPEPEQAVSPHPVTNTSETKDSYKKLTFDFNIPQGEVKKRKVFKLPEEILSGVGNWKKRKRGDIENEFALNHAKSFFSFLKHHGIQNFKNPECKIELSLRERRKLRMQKMKDRLKFLARLATDQDEGFQGFGEDECFDPNEEMGEDWESDSHDGGDCPVEPIDVGMVANLPQLASQQEETQTYEQDVVRTMTIYRENKLNQAKELSEIAKKVTAWQEALQGVLAQAEQRSQFDIHEYGTKILNGFTQPESEQPVRQFSDIVWNQPREEISRFLLSSLMLANTYNVELIQSQPGDLVKDCLSLKLLSRVRHHEEMDENMQVTSDGQRL